MCDTLVQTQDGATVAKNSDREPSEAQPVLRLARVRDDAEPLLRTTYMELPQVAERHAVLLSKPVWCWGAEMGVNECGVAIGNEAIFSRRASRTPALLGMDLVRLGLERGGSADQALEIIIRLLEAHGQGGPAGFRDKGFCYDSSFLIADASGSWVLETSGRDWVAKRVARDYAISNQLTLGRDHDLRSAGVAPDSNFAAAEDSRWLPFFARARQRRGLSQTNLALAQPASFAQMARHLRAHNHSSDDPGRGSNADVCMHARGYIRRHQTTGSMIARLDANGPRVVFTGTSAPCLSIFRPADFAGDFSVLTPMEQTLESLLWRRHEFLHRRALADAQLRLRLRSTRDEIEPQIFALLDNGGAEALQRADRLAAAWHKVLWEAMEAVPAVRGPWFWERLSRQDGLQRI